MSLSATANDQHAISNIRPPTENIRPPTDNIRPPTSMSLIKSLKLPSWPLSLHSYGSKVFVGLATDEDDAGQNAKILLTNTSLSNKQTFVNVNSNVTSVQAYNDELYVWFAHEDLINVYDLTGKLLRSWKHSCLSKYYNKLRVVSEKVVVSSAQDEALTVYNLQGQLLKQIKCPGICGNCCDYKAMAVCGNDSVIVSDANTSTISRVNIDSGEVMWTSKHVKVPQGVVCYKNRYVLVTNCNTNTWIWILDADTG